jgi:SAM-dependent methyltransferase
VDYYEKSRPEMLQFLPEGLTRLIDFGCAEGRFGEAVKARHPGCETWGVEVVPEAAAEAKTRNDVVHCLSLDSGDELPSAHFDVVTMNDVMEHLCWPEPALALAKRILRPGGRLVLSLPNVGYYLNVRELVIKNDWQYKDWGILDRTHFRFYTTKSAEALLRENGFDVLQIQGIPSSTKMKVHYKALFKLTGRRFQWMKFPQFAVVAVPKAEH